MLILTHQQQTAFENIVRKGEIARNEQFLLFPQCFLLNQIIASPFVYIAGIISLFAAESEEPEIVISGKGLRVPRSIIKTELLYPCFEEEMGKLFQLLLSVLSSEPLFSVAFLRNRASQPQSFRFYGAPAPLTQDFKKKAHNFSR